MSAAIDIAFPLRQECACARLGWARNVAIRRIERYLLRDRCQLSHSPVVRGF